MTWPNGAHYEGRFVSNNLQGQGVMTWPDGRRVEGSFYRPPVRQHEMRQSTRDVAVGDGSCIRFALDFRGEPDASTLTHLGSAGVASHDIPSQAYDAVGKVW